MAHAMIFDSLQYTKKLEAAGVKHKEAEAHANALAEIFEENGDHVATKRDLDTLKTEINLKFAEQQLILLSGLSVFLLHKLL